LARPLAAHICGNYIAPTEKVRVRAKVGAGAEDVPKGLLHEVVGDGVLANRAKEEPV